MRYRNVRVGDRRSFAIEFEFDEKSPQEDVWGCLWVWADGRCIGNCHEVEIIGVGLSALTQAGRSDHSPVPVLATLTAKGALDLVMWAIYGNDDVEREMSLGVDRRSLERFEIFPGASAVFFDHWQAILIDNGPDERCVYRQVGQPTFELVWASGTFAKLVREAWEAFRECSRDITNGAPIGHSDQ